MTTDSAGAPAPAAAGGTDPLRVVVLAGGLTFEREVSLSSGTQVAEELTRVGVDAELRDADAELLPGLAAAPASLTRCAIVPLPPPSEMVVTFSNRTPGRRGPSTPLSSTIDGSAVRLA